MSKAPQFHGREFKLLVGRRYFIVSTLLKEYKTQTKTRKKVLAIKSNKANTVLSYIENHVLTVTLCVCQQTLFLILFLNFMSTPNF